MLPIEKVSELNQKAQTLEAQQILSEALSLIPNIAISFSGAEDVVLIAMAIRIRKDIPVFTLDTGRLHSATYRFIERVRKHFKLNLEVLYPEAARVSELVSRKGLFSFYEDGHEECCRIRKVEPLRQKLATLDGWVTGQRRDQSPTRAQVPIYQIDNTFSSTEQSLIKVNPLANMSLQQVWEYIRMFDVPYNELHDQGFISIGCEPCSRATGPGQHEREGRWWWEEGTIKECGLHRDSMIATSSIKD